MIDAKDLAARLRELTRITGYATTKEAADLIEQQAAEIERLRADAERWRTFLATRPESTHEVICEAIDAARKGRLDAWPTETSRWK